MDHQNEYKPPSFNPGANVPTYQKLDHKDKKKSGGSQSLDKNDSWQPPIWNGEPVSREFNLFNWDSLLKNIKGNPYLWGSGAAGTVAMSLSINYALESGKFVAAVGSAVVLVAMIGFLAKHLHDKAMQYKSESVEGKKSLEKELENLWKETQKYFPYKKADDSSRYNAFKPVRGDFSKSLSTTLVGGIASLTAGAVALTANQYAPEVVVPYGWCMFTAVVAAAFLLLNRYARYCQEKHYHEQLYRQVTSLRQLNANLGKHFGDKAIEKTTEVMDNLGKEGNSVPDTKEKIAAKGFNSSKDCEAVNNKIFGGVGLNVYEKSLITGATVKRAAELNTLEQEQLKGYNGRAFKQDSTIDLTENVDEVGNNFGLSTA